jgi:hypothetical protein
MSATGVTSDLEVLIAVEEIRRLEGARRATRMRSAAAETRASMTATMTGDVTAIHMALTSDIEILS